MWNLKNEKHKNKQQQQNPQVYRYKKQISGYWEVGVMWEKWVKEVKR